MPQVAQALFAWPPQALVARPVAKAKIYTHAKPNAAVRALFFAQFKRIGLSGFLDDSDLPCGCALKHIGIYALFFSRRRAMEELRK